MASIKKRGKSYYVRFHKTVDGKAKQVDRPLGTKHKFNALKKADELESKYKAGLIDPFHPGFTIEEVAEVVLLKDAIVKFYEYKRKTRSSRTVQAYKDVIDHFCEWGNHEYSHINMITKDHITAFLLRDSDIAATTRHFNKRHLKAFWRWMIHSDRGYAKKDVVSDIELPKADRNIIQKMITLDELHEVFKAFDEHKKEKSKDKYFRKWQEQPWFKPIMMLYFCSGLRANEACNLKMVNLPELEYIHIPGKTKGHKDRIIPLSSKLLPYIKAWIQIRGKANHDDYLFVNHHDQKLTGDGVLRAFKKYSKLANIPNRTIHGFRHRSVTNWIEMGFSVAEARDMAGHSSTLVTDVYTHLSAKNLKAKMDRLEKG